MAACLWAGDGAAASHTTAAALHRFSGIGKARVEISAPRRLQYPGLNVYRRKLEPGDIVRVERIPTTGVPFTLLSLAAMAPRQRLETAVDEALVRRLVSLARLNNTLEKALRGVAGAAALRRVLETYTHAPIESPLERKFLRLLRAAGLPEPQIQYPIYDGDRFLARVDFA